MACSGLPSAHRVADEQPLTLYLASTRSTSPAILAQVHLPMNGGMHSIITLQPRQAWPLRKRNSSPLTQQCPTLAWLTPAACLSSNRALARRSAPMSWPPSVQSSRQCKSASKHRPRCKPRSMQAWHVPRKTWTSSWSDSAASSRTRQKPSNHWPSASKRVTWARATSPSAAPASRRS